MAITLHRLKGLMVNQYVLKTPLGLIAVDTGYPGGAPVFLKRLEKLAPVRELKYIFLTHAHDDHAGFLQDLMTACPWVKVIAHVRAIGPLHRGENEQPAGAGYATRVAALFSLVKKSFGFPKVTDMDRMLLVSGPEDQLLRQMGLPADIVLLPGHTADSMGLFLPETGELLCGDAAMNLILSRGKHTIWIEDAAQFGASWDTMLALHPLRIYPSHGLPFPPSQLKRHRHFMDGRKLIPLK